MMMGQSQEVLLFWGTPVCPHFAPFFLEHSETTFKLGHYQILVKCTEHLEVYNYQKVH